MFQGIYGSLFNTGHLLLCLILLVYSVPTSICPLFLLDKMVLLSFLLVLREPERSALWFQGKKGCFEAPQLGKDPSTINIPELEVSK